MCRGPCIRVALRQVILKLLILLTGQFLVPHPSFHSTNGLVRGPRVAESWRPEGRGGVGGRAEVTNVRVSLPFAELRVLREADGTSAQSVERRLFSPRSPTECGPPADRHPLRESVSLGSALDLLPTARPSLPRCHTRSHPKIDFLPSPHRRIGTYSCNAGAKVSDNHQHPGEPTPFSRVQGARQKL